MKEESRAVDLFTQLLGWEQLRNTMVAAPVELEIGSGKGLFLQQAGQADSNCQFIGVELAGKFADRAAQRIAHSNLPNVTVLRGDATKFLQLTVPDQCLRRIHVYFPDPWWRNKHKKRRVLNEQTLQDIQRTLVPGGEFHFWTDVLDYYEHICVLTMDTTQLHGPGFVPQRAAQHSMDYNTHFERRARLNSQPVYRAIFQR
jgi:tRNA (guanine-N7-)-methyltransferase